MRYYWGWGIGHKYSHSSGLLGEKGLGHSNSGNTDEPGPEPEAHWEDPDDPIADAPQVHTIEDMALDDKALEVEISDDESLEDEATDIASASEDGESDYEPESEEEMEDY